MKVFKWEEAVSSGLSLGKAGLSIGVFDGVHRGHQALIDMIVECRRSVVITFSVNPKEVLKVDSHQGDILTLNQKLMALEDLGVEAAVIIDFSSDFSKMSAEDFFRRIRSFMEIELLVVGDNFRCGRDGESGVHEVKSILQGSKVLALEPLTYRGHEISSSRIRKAIRCGDIAHANAMLGKCHTVVLPVETQRVQSDHESGSTTRDRTGKDVESWHVIRKSLVSQVTPKIGLFKGSIEVDGVFLPTRQIYVSREKISWVTDNSGRSDAIRFEEVFEN